MGWKDRDYPRRRRPGGHEDSYGDNEEDNDLPDDPEAPDASDQDSDEDNNAGGFGDRPELIRCPYCGKSIVEDAEWCHHCGRFVEERHLDRRPVWVWVGIVLALLMAIGWALGR